MEKKILLEQIALQSGCDRGTVETVWEGFAAALPKLLQEDESIELHEKIGRLVTKQRDGTPGGGGGRGSPRKKRKIVVFKEAAPLAKTLRQTDEEFVAALLEAGNVRQADAVLRRMKSRESADPE